jgi:hypothetical protein
MRFLAIERCIMEHSVERLSKTRSLAAALAIVCAGISGCARMLPYSAQTGEAEASVTARLGQPSERVKRAGSGDRLVYTRGPMGQGTTMIELGSDGRVQAAYEALTPQRLASIRPGMTTDQLRERLGPPAERKGLAIEGRKLWAWRFPTYDCAWFVVTLSATDRVLDAGPMADPRCDVDHD